MEPARVSRFPEAVAQLIACCTSVCSLREPLGDGDTRQTLRSPTSPAATSLSESRPDERLRLPTQADPPPRLIEIRAMDRETARKNMGAGLLPAALPRRSSPSPSSPPSSTSPSSAMASTDTFPSQARLIYVPKPSWAPAFFALGAIGLVCGIFASGFIFAPFIYGDRRRDLRPRRLPQHRPRRDPRLLPPAAPPGGPRRGSAGGNNYQPSAG